MFKIGDKVRCIQGSSFMELDSDRVYEVTNFDNNATIKVNKPVHPEDWCSISRFELVKEEKEEMKFDMKKEPWFVRVANEQEYNAARDWVKENTGYNLGISYFEGIAAITNTDDDGDVFTRVMWCSFSRRDNITCHEIKLTFKTIIDSVTFPEVKTEQHKQIEELEKTILLAKQQIETLKKGE